MTAATARALDFDGPNTRLQPRRSEELQHGSLARLHLIAPLQRPDNGAEKRAMSPGENHKTLGELVAAALARRIGYGITRKQLKHALNVSTGTIDNLLSGNTDPSPRVFMSLLQFFDTAFANEVLAQSGLTVVKLAEVRAAEKVIQGLAELQAAQGRVK